MSGRPLDAFRIVPGNLWRHLGAQVNVTAPDLASLRALYHRGRTLYDHQLCACDLLGFRWMTEHQRRYLVSVLREELEHTIDRDRLLLFTRRWLYTLSERAFHSAFLREATNQFHSAFR